jgi:hypothetical protein
VPLHRPPLLVGGGPRIFENRLVQGDFGPVVAADSPTAIAAMATLPEFDQATPEVPGQKFFSIGELASRWRCSRGTVYNRLRTAGALVLDFAPPGKKGKKCVPVNVVLQIERKQTRRLL